MTDPETTGLAAVEPDVTSVLDPVPAPDPVSGRPSTDSTAASGPRRWWRAGRSRGTPHKGAGRTALEWGALIVLALVIAFLIKTFLFQAFFIPSESMTPTLKVGDRVLVNKLSYDLHDVNRGDILVFEAPVEARSSGIEDLVKRAIALPGETLTADGDGRLLIDGRLLDEPYLPAGTVSPFRSDHPVPPGCGTPADGGPGCVVPKGHVFMMGDNRGASQDSRSFGPIDIDSIVGRVFVRIWPISGIGLL